MLQWVAILYTAPDKSRPIGSEEYVHYHPSSLKLKDLLVWQGT